MGPPEADTALTRARTEGGDERAFGVKRGVIVCWVSGGAKGVDVDEEEEEEWFKGCCDAGLLEVEPRVAVVAETMDEEGGGGGVDAFGVYMYCKDDGFKDDGFRVSCCGFTFIVAVGERIRC